MPTPLVIYSEVLRLLEPFEVDGNFLSLRTTADSALSLAQSASAGVYPLVTTNGIVFPATAVPSANANTLDDYEEGTWTPVIGGSSGESGQTYNYQGGVYTKIGNRVFASCFVKLAVAGVISGSFALIKGLPFAPALVAGNSPAVMYCTDFASLATNWVNINGGNQYLGTSCAISGRKAAAAGPTIDLLTPADIGDSTKFSFNFSYLT